MTQVYEPRSSSKNNVKNHDYENIDNYSNMHFMHQQSAPPRLSDHTREQMFSRTDDTAAEIVQLLTPEEIELRNRNHEKMREEHINGNSPVKAVISVETDFVAALKPENAAQDDGRNYANAEML